MTVNYEVPRLEFTGNGITTSYSFVWSSSEASDNYVALNDLLLTEGIEYELVEYDEEYGGRIEFYTAPVSGAQVLIYRKTPITQQIDYVQGEPFPANTHEFGMDKDTRILQELFAGGRGTGGDVNLTGIPHPENVEIDNSAGTDAYIEPWTLDGLLAGVSLGEVVPAGGAAPADGNPSDKPDGYIWFVLEALP